MRTSLATRQITSTTKNHYAIIVHTQSILGHRSIMAAFTSDPTFAKLVPANADARKSFSRCVEELQTNGVEFHLRVLEDSSLASSTEEEVNSDTG